MPEIITTKDGKNHTLVGSTSLISIIRDYCGDENSQSLLPEGGRSHG